MEALTERARQALGVGGSSFLPSSLEAQHRTLDELEVFAGPVKQLERAVGSWQRDTQEFLAGSCSFLSSCPLPRLWSPPASPLEPAAPAHTPVPQHLAAWFDAETHATLAECVPAGVDTLLRRELLRPLQQWQLAHQVAKGVLSALESRRLHYDAARRRLVARASSVAAAVEAREGEAPTGLPPPELQQLEEEATAAGADLCEFEADVEALTDHLAWLVAGAARLKALIANAAGGVASSCAGWAPVPELVPPPPAVSRIGESIEVSLTVADAPAGPAAVAAGADVASMLPSDDRMYADEGGAEPPGGGSAQLVDDAVLPPRGPGPGEATATATAGRGGGGSAPAPAASPASPPRTGGAPEEPGIPRMPAAPAPPLAGGRAEQTAPTPAAAGLGGAVAAIARAVHEAAAPAGCAAAAPPPAEAPAPRQAAGPAFVVQGAEESGTPGAPGTPASLGGSPNVPAPSASGPGEPGGAGSMHIGPVPPFPGSTPEPGTAEFVKGPSPAGGAAALPTGAPAGADAGGRCAGAGGKQGAAARGAAGGGGLPKTMPTFEEPYETAKPAGGGVGAFLRDTLLGPAPDEPEGAQGGK